MGSDLKGFMATRMSPTYVLHDTADWVSVWGGGGGVVRGPGSRLQQGKYDRHAQAWWRWGEKKCAMFFEGGFLDANQHFRTRAIYRGKPWGGCVENTIGPPTL